MAVCLSNKYVLFKYLGVFETEPVDPDIPTVNVHQLLYHILWTYLGRYHHREYRITPESPECVFVSCNHQNKSPKDHKRMRKSGWSRVGPAVACRTRD